MIIARNKQLEEICSNIDFRNFKNNNSSIILINEAFGTGKTTLVNALINKIETEKIVDILITFQNEEKASFFTEILAHSSIKFISHEDQSVLKFDETSFNFTQFREILHDLKKIDSTLFNRLTNFLILKSNSEYFTFKTNNDLIEEKKYLEDEIGKIVKEKGLIRLIFESPRVVIESFIIDLLNAFFPLKEGEKLQDYIGNFQKPNITLILDDYESIGYCVNKWLINDFFHYAFNARFDEFFAYELSGISGDYKVSDFFDFKFVISTREKLQLTNKYQNIHNFKDKIKRVEIPSLNIPEIVEYVSKSGINLNELNVNFEKISKGNLYILDLLVESTKLGYLDNENSNYATKVSNLILEFQSNDHSDWIRSACFLEVIEEYGLRCFPQISEDFKSAYEYLYSCTDLLVESSLQKGIIELHPLVKETLKKSLKIDSIQTFIEYENIIKIYNDVKDFVNKLTFEELEAIRDLAYFKKFSLNLKIEREILNDLEIIKSIKDKNQDWFINHKNSFSLNVSIANQLKLYNKLVDLNCQKTKEERAKKLWNDYLSFITSEIGRLHKEIENLSTKTKDINRGVVTNKQQYEEIQRSFMDKENKLIELRKRLSTFSTTKPLTAALTNIGLSIGTILLTLAFPTIFENIENENSITAIQIALYFLAAIFFGFSGVFIYKLIQIFKSKDTIEELNIYIQKIEQEKYLQQEEMGRINQEKEMIPRKMDDISKQISAMRDQIKLNSEIQAETFI